jgi:hypothetical protein
LCAALRSISYSAPSRPKRNAAAEPRARRRLPTLVDAARRLRVADPFTAALAVSVGDTLRSASGVMALYRTLHLLVGRTSIVGVTQFGKVGRAVTQILGDEYLDLYVLAATAFVFTILGAVGVASVVDLASIILGLLAVLAFSQIRTRRHIASIVETQRANPLARFKTAFPQNLIERRAAATDVLLIGLSMSRTVQGTARTDMRRTLVNGGRVRVLVMDPTDDALIRAVSGNSSMWQSAERLKARILGTLDELSDLRVSTAGRLEIRVAPFTPMMGVNALNLSGPDGVIVVQHYEYKPDAEASPIFELKVEDGFWFNHYAAEANRMWEDGIAWPLSEQQVLTRAYRPSFGEAFGPELQDAMSQASSILITGIARNGLVNSSYSALEDMLRKGCQIRFLLVDPDSDAAVYAANRYYAERSPDSVRERTRQTIRLLGELHRAAGNISVRLTGHPLALGVVATKQKLEDNTVRSALFVEYYPYRASGKEPKFVLLPTDGYWYERFRGEAEALWDDADDIDLNDVSPRRKTQAS